MAKKQKSRKKAVPGGAAEAAAIRWYALSIELRALELVITNKETFNDVRDVLRMAKHELVKIKPVKNMAEADCPPPWDVCADAICRPDCGDVRLGSCLQRWWNDRRFRPRGWRTAPALWDVPCGRSVSPSIIKGSSGHRTPCWDVVQR